MVTALGGVPPTVLEVSDAVHARSLGSEPFASLARIRSRRTASVSVGIVGATFSAGGMYLSSQRRGVPPGRLKGAVLAVTTRADAISSSRRAARTSYANVSFCRAPFQVFNPPTDALAITQRRRGSLAYTHRTPRAKASGAVASERRRASSQSSMLV